VNHLAGILDRFDDEQDREAVVRCARGIYWLYGQMFRGLEAESSRISTPAAKRRTA